MRSLLLIIFILSFQLALFSQSPADKLAEQFKISSLDLPADQVFLHIDRNLYHPGDTIRFQAYIRDRQTGVFETKSISLYSLLLNLGHKTIDSARFRILNSTASGWLEVPELTSTGDYSILAFTSTMMNYDPKYVFSAPIRIDKRKVSQSATDTKSGKNDSPSNHIRLPQPTIDLRFLPEGGTYIYGIPQRMAFNAVTSFGKTLNIEGEILNQKNEKISVFRSGELVPGLVEITPSPGDNYFAILHGVEFSGMKWPLPVPEKAGVTLRVNNNENGLLEIKIEGKGVSGMTYHLSLIMNNILVLAKEFRIDTLFKFKVSTEELPVGTAYITLFDNELNPAAERLVFVNDHKKMNIEVTASDSVFKRADETEITINATDADGKNLSSILSVSVFDSLSGYYNAFPSPDIESTFLFDRDFYNNLPLKTKLHQLNDLDQKSVDLLLMTYGWRKFTLKENPAAGPKKDLVNYDYLKISNPGLERKSRSELKLVSLEGSEIYTMETDKNNEAKLFFDTLASSVRQVIVMPDKNPSKNVNPIKIEFPENKSFTDRAKALEPFKNDYTIDIPLQKKIDMDFGLDSAIMIEAVIIKGSKKPQQGYYDKYQEQYSFSNTTTITKKEMVGCLNFEDILLRVNPYRIDRKNKAVELRPGGGGTLRATLSNQGYKTALFVLDDIPIYEGGVSTYRPIADMPADQIASVTAVRGSRGFTFYGQDAMGGVIFVTTVAKQMSEGNFSDFEAKNKKFKTDLMKPTRIFRTEIEYYVPKKEEVLTMPEFQYRPTLLWKNEVFLDGTGPVKIKFPNNLVKGTVIVIVNGVSFSNVPGTGSTNYSVR